LFDPRCLPSSRGPSRGSASVPRLGRRGPLPGIRSLVAVARFELAACPPARPRPDLRLGGSCHSPTSAICKEYEHTGERPIPASKPARDGGPRCAPRVAPRNACRRRGKRNRSSAGAEAPPRRPRTRRVGVRAAADRPAHRASGTSWSPPCPTRGAGDAGMRVAAVEAALMPAPREGNVHSNSRGAFHCPGNRRGLLGSAASPAGAPMPLRAPGFPTFTPLFAGRCSSP
jgi:hypothetical protein